MDEKPTYRDFEGVVELPAVMVAATKLYR